jgi:integrase
MDEKEILYPEIKRQLDRYAIKTEESNEIKTVNKKHILNFLTSCKSKGLSIGRQYFYAQRLYPIGRRFKKDFKALDRNDIESYMASLNHLGPWARDAYTVTLQVLFRYLFNLVSRDRLPEAVRFLKRTKGKNNIKAEDLFSSDEIQKMIDLAPNLKWKATVAICSEVGLRTGELRALKLKDISIRPNSIKIRVESGKMAGRCGARDVFIVQNYEIVKAHVKDHPRFGNQDAWFFDNGDKPISTAGLNVGLKRIALKAGIKRKVCVYTFRHSVATRLYRRLPTEVARRLMGHEANSNMPGVYTHLKSDDLEHSLLEMNGISSDETQLSSDDLCPRCGQEHGSDMYKKALEIVKEMAENGELEKLREIAAERG